MDSDTMKIVIVEDSGLIRALLKEILEAEGFRDITVFGDPLEALDALREAPPPDMVISNYKMPRVNGVELLDRLSALFPRVGGVIVTGNPELLAKEPDVRYPVLDKGHIAFHRQLIETIRRVVPLSKSDSALPH